MQSIAHQSGQKAAAIHDDVVLSRMDKPIAVKMPLRRLGITLGALLLVAILVYGYLDFAADRVLVVGAERISISTVSQEVFREYIPVTGNVVPRESVFVDAIDGGQIAAVYVEVGQMVTGGQPLALLKNTRLQLDVIGREAQLTEQLNNLSVTSLSFEQNQLRYQRELIEIDHQIDRIRRQLARSEPLAATGVASAAEIDDLDANLKYQKALRVAVLKAQDVNKSAQSAQISVLEEALAAMNKNLSITRENLQNLTITAPISGQVTLLNAHVGETRSAGERIGQIDDLEAFKVNAFIDEFFLSQVKIGQIASVEIDGADYSLEVSKVYPEVRSRQFEVDFRFLGIPPELIRRGQTVRMRLEIGQPSELLTIKNGAFFDDTGGRWVFLIDESNSSAFRQDVRLGRRNAEAVEILEGLRNGDRVITSSYERFLDADKLQLQRDSR